MPIAEYAGYAFGGLVGLALVVAVVMVYKNWNSPSHEDGHSYSSNTSSNMSEQFYSHNSHSSNTYLQGPTTTNNYAQTNNNFQNKKKITYNRSDQFRLTNSNCSLYRGKFEEKIDVAVKKVRIHQNDTAQINIDLQSLGERLRRVVDINHDILREGSVANIVRFFCYEFERGYSRTYLLLALELCDCNLEEYVPNRHNYPPISNNDIITQILCGLQYLHSRQIVHRDLKPSNILVKQRNNNELQFKLSDFGLSKLNTQTQNGIPTEFSPLSDEYGTEHWIPPEIFALRGQRMPDLERSYWKRSDIFPLGLVFYFIVTDGQYVFRSQDDIQRERADFSHVSGNRPLLHLLRHMLNPRPQGRPYTEDVMKHPALWSCLKILDFFESISNLLTDQIISRLCTIETNAVNVLRGSWDTHLTPQVKSYIFPTAAGTHNRRNRNQNQPYYDATSVKSLIRAIRNNKGHYFQSQQAVRAEYGNYPDGYIHYWTSKFPDLLMHTYDTMRAYRTETSIQPFYA